MLLNGFTTLRIDSDSGVLTIALDNPPVNALSATMMRELRVVLDEVREDASIRFIVFTSADPEFFIAHVDMGMAAQMDELRQLAAQAPAGVNVFQAVGELLRHQPQVTIVKLVGLARGGGAEFVAAADMTFAAAETAGLAQSEALMGLVASGGATQYLHQKTGRNRALEILLTGDLFDARTAAAYGWINRAVPTVELDAHVDHVARTIAALPDGVVAGIKSTLPPADFTAGFAREESAWNAQMIKPEIQQRMAAITARGAQTREGERDLEGLLRSL